MGGGDLNLKKSWHPSLLRNQERVWAEEKRALEERKRIDQLRRERDEERQIQELQRLQEESGNVRPQNRVDWMYQAPSGAGGQYSEEMEGYLLGKRRIDGILLKNDESKKLEKGAGAGAGADLGVVPVQPPTNARDTMSKVMADPLLEIKKREQAAWETVVKETVKRGDRERRRGRDEDRPHRRDRDRRSHRHRSRSRSRSPDGRREREHRRRRDDGDRFDRDHYRRGDGDRERGRDRRDRDRDRDDRDQHHHRSNRHRGHNYEDRYARRSSYHQRRPSASPPAQPDRHDRPPRNYGRYGPRGQQRDPPIIHHAPRPDPKDQEAERQRKVAEMQSNAQDMETTRRQRIADVTAVEEQRREQEDRQRTDRGRFVGQMHRQLQEDNLDDRLRRNRGGLARVDDD